MCTYRRPDAVVSSLEAIGRQTRPVDLLVVVDNDNDPAVRAAVESQVAVEAFYVGARANGGPAGAFNTGLAALPAPGPDDLVVLFDDDDPPVAPESIDRLVGRFDELDGRGAPVGGVGLHGGVLDVNRGRVRPPDGDRGTVSVDHLHGGYLPLYRHSSIHDVGGFDPNLFWGFEELDLGRRLSAAGCELVVDMDHWNEVAALYPKATARRGVKIGVSAPTPSRYYTLRNLLRVLGRQRAWGAIAEVVAVRAIGKPLLGLIARPGDAVANLAMNLLAVTDAATGRMGRRDRFPAICGVVGGETVPGRIGRPAGSEELDVPEAEHQL